MKKLFEDLKHPTLNESGEYSRLHRDFGAEIRVKRHNDHELVFADRTAIFTISAGASNAGLKHNNQHPTLFDIDDSERREDVQSKTQRDKTWEWFTRDRLPMRNPQQNRIVWVGTLLHEDAARQRGPRLGSFHVIKQRHRPRGARAPCAVGAVPRDLGRGEESPAQ